MLESTEGERLPWCRLFSGGKDVCRKCEGPAVEGFLRLGLLVPPPPNDGRFLGRLMLDSGGDPAGGEVAMLASRGN
jgi:hypothetical protein